MIREAFEQVLLSLLGEPGDLRRRLVEPLDDLGEPLAGLIGGRS